MKRRIFSSYIVMTLMLAMPTARVYGQAVKASLIGSITDSSGAMVPRARVVIAEVNTGFSRAGETNESGHYVFGNLDPGVYRVQVEMAGFKTAVRDRVEVLVNSTVRVDLQLAPGQVTESVQVVAAVPLLQTDRSDVSHKIEVVQVANLPLTMNRNFQGLLAIVPGTSRLFRPHSEFFNPQDSIATQVNGQSRLSNNIQLEGIDDNHRTGLLTALIPPIEAIQTLDVTTSNYDAELGRAGGAVINVALKSGTNELHGSVFEFNRVSRTAARNFFATTKAPTTFNQYGATLGGPIAKNRTFFFADYQGIRDRRGDITRATIPTLDVRSGDFSGIISRGTGFIDCNQTPRVGCIYDPRTGDAQGRGRVAFPNNGIPDARISPIARKVLSFIPPPTVSGLATNYERATVRRKDMDSFDVKMDHQFNEKNTLMYRYSYQWAKTFDPGLYELYGGPKGGGFAGLGTQRAQNTALNYTHIFSPRTIAEFRFGVMRYRNDAKNQDTGRKTAEEIGIRGANLDEFTSGITSFNIDAFTNPVVGFAASLPWIRAETNFDMISNWTRVTGNHTLKFGVDVRRNRDELLQTQTYNPRGTFIFRGGPTALNAPSPNCGGAPPQIACPSANFGNSFAAFLLDVPNEFGRDLPGIFPTFRQSQIFTYFQDKWQITPKLTVDFGLRHEIYVPPTSAQRAGFSNYNPATNSLELAGVGSVPKNLGLENDWKNFAPRFGIAYRVNEKTVVRGGYGVTIDPSYPDDKWAFNFPVKQNNAFLADNSFSAAGSMAAGFPPPRPTEIPSTGIIANAPEQGYLVLPKDLRQGYLQFWNVTFQRALPRNFAFEAGYVANHAIGVLANRNINAALVPGTGAAGQPLNQRFGRRAGTGLWVPTGSTYQALQVKFDRRFSGGFALTTAYTYSRTINLSDDNGGFFIPSNPGANRGRAGFDRTQTWVQSFVYDLPFGPRGRWLRSGVGRWLLGDWQVNGIFSAYAGTPLNVTISAASLNAPGNGNRPNLIGRPAIFGAIGRGVKFFDVTKFSPPPPNTFGTTGRNILNGPGIVSLDFGVFRKIPITERISAELRMESFNFTNTPHFNNPNGDFSSASFGEVTGAAADQRTFQFALKVIF